MQAIQIDEILTELGWSDGFRIPVANEDNRKLEDEVLRMIREKQELAEELESMQEKLKTVQQHSSNLLVEREENDKLINIYLKQMEAENNLRHLEEGKRSKMSQEIKEFRKKSEDIEDRTKSQRLDCERLKRKIKRIEKEMKADEGALRELDDVLGRTEQDKQMLRQILKDDLKKFQKLELERQKLSVEYDKVLEASRRIFQDTENEEKNLEQATKMYAKTLKERRETLHQLAESTNVLKQRDEAIYQLRKEIEILKEIGREKNELTREAERTLNNQIRDNKELQLTITKMEKRLTDLRQEHQSNLKTLKDLEVETNVQKNLLRDLILRTDEMKAKAKHEEAEVGRNKEKVEKIGRKIEELKGTLREVKDKETTLVEKTKQLESMIEDQEKTKSELTKKLENLWEMIRKTTNEVTEKKNEARIIEMEITNENKKILMLNQEMEKEEKLLAIRKDALQDVEFEEKKLEARLNKMRGIEEDKTEQEKKKREIEELKAILEKKKEEDKLLKTQISNVEREIRQVKNAMEVDAKELERLMSEKRNFELLIETGQKRIKEAQAEKEEKLVQQNILQLKIRHAEKASEAAQSKVYTLEKARLELDAAVKEYKAEIALERETIISEKREIEKEKSELKMAISERQNRIKQLQQRYDNVIATHCTNPDGSQIGVAELQVKAVQERGLLQEKGDQLDAAIRKAELEIQSMENTLRVVKTCNEKFKSSLQPKPDKDTLAKQEKINEDLQNARDTLKEKQKQLKEVTDEWQKIKDNIEQLEETLEREEEEKEEKERYLNVLNKQISTLREKTQRAEKSIQRINKELETVHHGDPDHPVLFQQRDLEVRQLKEINVMALQELAEFSIRHIEVEPFVKRLMEDYGINLPQITDLSSISKDSRSSSFDQRVKSTCRSNVTVSSKSSISNIVNIEPSFELIKATSKQFNK
ncbi:coiled-coil domain-containing protein 39-like [Prorops nasuta]|uniref:coiled-coil domain-containing protein 39-like n=1 Tax=Prorops nasuta TaxID=863751 RepID=UPI0034CD76FB